MMNNSLALLTPRRHNAYSFPQLPGRNVGSDFPLLDSHTNPALDKKRSLIAEIGKLICVSRPYFALENLKLDDHETLHCDFQVENMQHQESTIISAAEAGRHMAILGSCALALDNPLQSKHYYLASKAHLTRHDDRFSLNNTNHKKKVRLFAEADVMHIDIENRTGRVTSQISTEEGDPVFSLDVSYSVLKAEVFERLFKKNFNPEIFKKNKRARNPYVNQPHAKLISFDGNTMQGDLGTVSPEQCVGHFDYCPALPIAILCATLEDFGITHLEKMLSTNGLKCAVKDTKVNSSKLAFVGSHVFIQSRFLSNHKNNFTFLVQAHDENGKPFGEIETTYAISNEFGQIDTTGLQGVIDSMGQKIMHSA